MAKALNDLKLHAGGVQGDDLPQLFLLLLRDKALLRIALWLDLYDQHPSIFAPKQEVRRVAVPFLVDALVPKPEVSLFRTGDGTGKVDVFDCLRTLPIAASSV